MKQKSGSEIQRKRSCLVAGVLCLGLLLTSCGAAPAEPSVDLDSPGPYTELVMTAPGMEQGISVWTLYEQPEESSPVIAELPLGTSAIVLEEREDGWRQVIAGERIGWQKHTIQEEACAEPSGLVPIPDFLPEELQLLYAKATVLYEMYAPMVQNITGWNGYADGQKTIERENGLMLAEEALYPTRAELDAAFASVFTPEFIQANFAPDENWFEIEGRLYGRGGDRGSWGADAAGFELKEKTKKKICFDLLLTYGPSGDWKCALPIEMIHTGEGWRVNEFTTPCDDTRWVPEMGEDFDPWEAMALSVEKATDSEGNVIRKTITYDYGRTVIEYAPDGRELNQLDYYGEELSSEAVWEYDENGQLLQKRSTTWDSDGESFVSVIDPEGALLETTDFDAEGRQVRRIVNRHSENGDLTATEEYDAEDRLDHIAAFEHDEKGRLTVQRLLAADGSEIESWGWEYDAEGFPVKETWRKDGMGYVRSFDQKYRLVREEEYAGNELSRYELYEYGQGWQWTERRSYDAAGKLLNTEQRELDDQNRVIRETVLIADRSPKQINDYEYHSNGSIYREQMKWYEDESVFGFCNYHLYSETGDELEYGELDEEGKLLMRRVPVRNEDGLEIGYRVYDGDGNQTEEYFPAMG